MNLQLFSSVQFSRQSCPTLCNPMDSARQASLSITKSQGLLKPMSIVSVMPSNRLILCRPLLLPPAIFPRIRVFSNQSVLRIRWPKYWSFSFTISPSNEHPELISFTMDWLDLLAVQGTLKSLLQHHSSKASILWHSAFFIDFLLLLTYRVAQTVKCLPTMWETRILIPASGRSPGEGNGNPLQDSCLPSPIKGAQRNIWASLVAQTIMHVCLQRGRPGFDPWVRKIPWRRKWQPTPVLLPGKFHGLRSLVGYSPWGRKESDTTERLHFQIHFTFFIVQLSHPYMTTGKTIALTRQTCQQSNVSAF